MSAEHDEDRRRVNARLDGCDHPLIADVAGGWACESCGQWFIPLLTEPVRPRSNGDNSRLSGFQDW